MRKMFRYTWILLGLIVIYLGLVYYSRWSKNQAWLEEQEKANKRSLSKVYGDGSLAILNFYTTAPSIRPGETAQLCYGVSGAESVRIEPPVQNVWPAYSRCIEVAPKSDTVYRLIAKDAAGKTVTAEAAIKISKD
jgi:hypothetical protein